MNGDNIIEKCKTKVPSSQDNGKLERQGTELDSQPRA